MAEEFFIPKLGQTVEEVTLVKWLVADGAKVSQGQEVMEVETDKAVFPVEANAKGYIHIGPYKEGEVVPVLTVVALIGKETDNFEAVSSPRLPEADSPAESERAAPAASQAAVDTAPARGTVFLPPRARETGGEKNVDLAEVTPTGYGGESRHRARCAGLSGPGAQSHAGGAAHGGGCGRGSARFDRQRPARKDRQRGCCPGCARPQPLQPPSPAVPRRCRRPR